MSRIQEQTQQLENRMQVRANPASKAKHNSPPRMMVIRRLHCFRRGINSAADSSSNLLPSKTTCALFLRIPSRASAVELVTMTL